MDLIPVLWCMLYNIGPYYFVSRVEGQSQTQGVSLVRFEHRSFRKKHVVNSWQDVTNIPVAWTTTRWWFQTCFIFNPTWRNDQNLTNIFQMCWNHQLLVEKRILYSELAPRVRVDPNCQFELTSGCIILDHPGSSWCMVYTPENYIRWNLEKNMLHTIIFWDSWNIRDDMVWSNLQQREFRLVTFQFANGGRYSDITTKIHHVNAGLQKNDFENNQEVCS